MFIKTQNFESNSCFILARLFFSLFYFQDTLLKIRSGKQGEPKARKKVREQESCKDQINSEETSPLKEVGKQKFTVYHETVAVVMSTQLFCFAMLILNILFKSLELMLCRDISLAGQHSRLNRNDYFNSWVEMKVFLNFGAFSSLLSFFVLSFR